MGLSCRSPAQSTSGKDQAVEAYLEQQKDFDTFKPFIGGVLHKLLEGDSQAFVANTTECLLKKNGKQAVEDGSRDIVSFFSDFAQLNQSISIYPSSNECGDRGFSVYNSFVTRSGATKYFVIYVVRHNSTMQIGNLVLNKQPQGTPVAPLK